MSFIPLISTYKAAILAYERELEAFVAAERCSKPVRRSRKGAEQPPADSPDVYPEAKKFEVSLDQYALAILFARDEIQSALAKPGSIWTESNSMNQDALQLAEVDQQCQLLSRSPAWSDRVNRLRASFRPEVDEKWWWWFPKPQTFPNRYEKFWDWGLKWFTNILWVIALAVLINISSRVIAGMPDVLGTGAVLVNTLLSVLVGKGILTGTSSWLEQQMDSLGISKHNERVCQLVLAFTILIIALRVHHDLPVVSSIYFNKAEALYAYHQVDDPQDQPVEDEPTMDSNPPTVLEIPQRGFSAFTSPVYQWFIGDRSKNAQADYFRATKLDPANWKAHNRLGETYEDQGDLTQAIAAYQTATKGDLPASLINLSRYYITQENSDQSPRPYLTAIGLLKKASIWIAAEKKQLKRRNLNESTQSIQWKPTIVIDEYHRSIYHAWAHLKLAQVTTRSDEKQVSITLAMDQLQGAIENYEENSKVDPKVIPERLAPCIRAELIDTYQEAKLPPHKKHTRLNGDSDKDWKACGNRIARLRGAVRPYQAGWLTQAERRYGN